MAAEHPENLALMLSGGGARAAYQVGILRALLRRHPELAPSILTGVSAGAINAAFLAAQHTPMRERAEALCDVWNSLTVDTVFHVETGVLAANVLRSGLKLVSGGWVHGPQARSLVDTAPLRELLRRVCRADADGTMPGIAENLSHGSLRAVAITASDYSSERSITFVQGQGVDPWVRAHRRSVACTLNVEHVMASSALPIFFPAIQLDGSWYGDGGIRLSSPLSPAVHLGATKILAISTRYARTPPGARAPAIDPRAPPTPYPPPAQILGVLFNAVFLDLFDADALALERVNRLIEQRPSQAGSELRPVRLLVLRPSRDLGQLANEHEPKLPRAFRFLTRGLGTRETRSNDMLSLVMFQPDYLARLIELGEQDGERRAGDIDAFLGT